MSAYIGVLGTRSAEHVALFRQWDRLLHLMVRKNISRLGSWFDRDDLMNVARQSLWRAHEAYDPNDGANFQTFARAVMGNAFNAMHKYALAECRRDRIRSVSSDVVDEITGLPVVQLVADSVSTDDAMSAEEDSAVAREALDGLKGRDLKIMTDRLVLNRTLDEIGRDLGLSRERVRQIERAILSKMAFAFRRHFPGRPLASHLSLRMPTGRRPE